MLGIAAGATSSSAQPNVRDHRTPPPPAPAERDHRRPPPPAADLPREAPPSPREERIEARAGFVWIQGRWDWRAGKWDWIPGHWERERAGKHWREARWEQRDGGYVLIDGEWVDASAAPPPPPAPPAPDRGDHHREWKLDRPMVSSFWPVKGKIGSRIVIRGRNFPEDTAVLWGGAQVAGAKVEPDRIVVAVPAGATSGTLSLRTGRHRELTVGNYEVANYDAEAEARRIAEQERKRAEQAWAERQKLLAKDRAARLAAIDHHHRELSESREQRRADRLREIRAKWEAAFLADPDTQAELTLHAQRGAELARMREVAELSENGKLVIRIGVAQSREDDRHQARMTALHDGFGRKP
ncbi:MAG TPA: IPT/TIG domain-containing protein [Kofleriaceae bacterium]|nr:IPT/TIG domain-containing protein [Kofleriaceae bacterium]